MNRSGMAEIVREWQHRLGKYRITSELNGSNRIIVEGQQWKGVYDIGKYRSGSAVMDRIVQQT